MAVAMAMAMVIYPEKVQLVLIWMLRVVVVQEVVVFEVHELLER